MRQEPCRVSREQTAFTKTMVKGILIDNVSAQFKSAQASAIPLVSKKGQHTYFLC